MHNLRWRLITINLCVVCVGFGAAFLTTPLISPLISQSVSRGDTFAQETQTGQSKRASRVTLVASDSSIRWLINEVTRQVGLKPNFYDGNAELNRRRSVNLKDVSVVDAISEILKGTQLVSSFSADGETLLIRHERQKSSDAMPPDSVGRIEVQVLDSTTKQAIRGATVSVVETKASAVTNEHGQLVLQVPRGKHQIQVRLIGYRTASVPVTVADGKAVRVTISLAATATSLNQVVTTVTGSQRRLEVGHDIVSLNVDSVMQTAPIASMTDLLETRVPGMTVQRTSGTPGDPARIRLRGTGSINQNNDPIIIVDGIRMHSDQSSDDNVLNGSGGSKYPTPSPLDQIDPSIAERVDVLKGPSASAMYGSDAANGVILITTKRGRPGPPRVGVTADMGISYLPGKWPESQWQWASPLLGGLPYVCIGFCGDSKVDSVVWFQALNHPQLTPLGNGRTMNTSVDVSGGSNMMQYSTSASIRRERGLLKLPAIEIDRYRKFHEDAPPPGWMRRPNLLERRAAQAQMNVDFSPTTSAGVKTTLNQTTQYRTSMSSSENSAIREMQVKWVDFSQLDERPLLGNPYERVQVNILNLINSIEVNSRAISWLPLRGSLGWNIMSEGTEMQVPRGLLLTADSSGVFRGANRTDSRISGNLVSPLDFFPKTKVTVGVDFSQTTNSQQSGEFFGTAPGVDDPSSGTETARATFRRGTSQQSSFGWFVEPKLNMNSRFFVIPGFRLDENGISGDNAKFLALPRLSLSWLVSDESFFPAKSIIQEFRIRTALGVAGVPPSPTQKLRLYTTTQVNPNNEVDPFYGDMLRLSNLGNSRLRPERGFEFEGGFDTDLWEGRVRLQATFHRKRRIDAIVNNNYAPSIDGGGTRSFNVGDITNSGAEFSLQAQLIDRPELGVSFQGTFSHLRSLVTRLSDDGESINLFSANIRYVVGYPMEGRWAIPVLGYADLDGNGWLGTNELVLASTAKYIGSTEPRYQAGFHPSVSLFRGRLSFHSVVSYTAGQLQMADPNMGTDAYGDWMLAPFVRNQLPDQSGFDRQAAFVAYNKCGAAIGDCQVSIGYSQVVDVLRLQSMSINLILGKTITRKLKATRASLSLQGSNLGLWTNYIGVDPNVNSSHGNHGLSDRAVQPQPRQWSIRCSLGY